jgi:hypothetical protein
LLGRSSTPEVRTLLAEVRSDASLDFDPKAAPAALLLNNVAFGAVIQWRVDVSWSQAQQIQQWLMGMPAGGVVAPNRQVALKDFFENLQAGAPPGPFLEYVGTYLTANISHASSTLIVGMRVPTRQDVYQAAFQSALTALLSGPAGWPGELVNFLKMMLNQPTSREEFLTLASNVGDLAASGPPLIKTLIT